MASSGPTAVQLGQHLQELREAAGVSIPQIAEHAGMAVDRVVMIESGMVEPSADELMLYASGLGMRMSVIIRLWERSLN